MINLFHLPQFRINSKSFSHALHDEGVSDLEAKLTNYVGAKYGVLVNSATNAIFLALLNKNQSITIPSLIPPVVINAIITSNNSYEFNDNVEWIGNSYILHKFKDYKIIDSAQKIKENQFLKEARPKDLMIFSFYPTKPLGGIDGGLVVSDDKEKIEHLRTLSFNGTTFKENNWERQIIMPGYKFYMSSVQASVILSNLKAYDKKIKKINQIREIYNEAFSMQNTSDHLYRINVKDRDAIILKAKSKNIICGIHYRAMHRHPVFYKDVILPKSEQEEITTLSIPFHENLSVKEAKYVVNFFKPYL